MNKLSETLDYLSSTLCISAFLLLFFYSRFKRLTISLFAVLLFLLPFSVAYFYVLGKNTERRQISDKEKLELKSLEKFLLTSPYGESAYFLCRNFGLKGNLSKNRLEDENSITLLCFDGYELSESDVYANIKSLDKALNIFCISIPNKLKREISEMKNVSVFVYTALDIYRKMQKSGIRPPLEIKEERKTPWTKRLTEKLSMVKPFGLFTISITLLILSFFSPYKGLYQILAFIFFAIFLSVILLKWREN